MRITFINCADASALHLIYKDAVAMLLALVTAASLMHGAAHAQGSPKPELLIQDRHSDKIHSVAFSPDGKMLVSGGNDRTVNIWDVSSGRLIRTFEGHNELVTSVTFSPDGKTIASGSFDKTLKLWEVSSGRPIRSFKGHSDWVYSVAFSPDGKIVASGSGNTLKLWEVSSGRPIRSFGGNVDRGPSPSARTGRLSSRGV
jgi:WD40 repeat protein